MWGALSVAGSRKIHFIQYFFSYLVSYSPQVSPSFLLLDVSLLFRPGKSVHFLSILCSSRYNFHLSDFPQLWCPLFSLRIHTAYSSCTFICFFWQMTAPSFFLQKKKKKKNPIQLCLHIFLCTLRKKLMKVSLSEIRN